MEIQWFPGHMTKSMRMMEESVKLCDGIIYVVDARAPFACVNANLFKIFANKPVLIVVNKADLVAVADLDKIVANLGKEGYAAVCVNGTLQKEVAKIYSAVVGLLAEKISKNKEKGVNKPLRMMVAGIPNTGKSTVINSLCGEKRAITGNKAGVTRGKQWIRLKDIELLDTPGTMPPKFENQYYARHLGYIGSINDDILDLESLCLEFIGEMKEGYPNELKEKYGLSDISGEPLGIFEEICKKRGYLFKGGEYDYTRGARAVFDDFRKGRMGRICLETQRYER
ncbi:MAG: ribosome biogenesis GTPase YlqF [Clostridia bacterium]|nr:ribosome biogenesis GTPase YlqF [Clostridia bacterium]